MCWAYWVGADAPVCQALGGGRDTPVPTKCFLSKRAGGDLRRMPESWRSGRGRPNASSLLKPDVKAEKFGESQMFGGLVGDAG